MSKQLPPRPNLKQLKIQAKDLRKALQAGDAEAFQRLKSHLPRFSDASDDELRAGVIPLQDCQHVIAREYGFESWNWLRAFVEVDFGLVARLSKQDIRVLLHQVGWGDLLLAVYSDTDDSGEVQGCPEDVRDTLLSNMSEQRRAYFVEEMDTWGRRPQAQVKEMQQEILKLLNNLAADGEIAGPTGGDMVPSRKSRIRTETSPRLLELVKRPLEQMSTDEIAEMWSAMAEEARLGGVLWLEPIEPQIASPFVREAVQQAANHRTESDLIRVILETRSQSVLLPELRMRTSLIIEGLVAFQAGDSPYIVRYKLGVFYQSEPYELEGGFGKVQVEELVNRLQETPVPRMTLAQITMFLTDMSGIGRREGLKAFLPVIQTTDYPLLRQGLEMLLDQVDIAQMETTLKELQKEELEQIEARHRMVIAGIQGMQNGDRAEVIEQKVRDAAVQETRAH